MQKVFLVVAALLLLAAGFYIGWQLKPVPYVKPKTITVTVHDVQTVTAPGKIQYVPRIQWEKPTDWKTPVPDSLDSKKPEDTTKIPVATLDTVMTKSIGDSVTITNTLSIRYALPPVNQYKVNLDSKVHFTTHSEVIYVPEPKTFWSRWSFGPLIGAGLTNDLKFNSFIGVGVLYNLR